LNRAPFAADPTGSFCGKTLTVFAARGYPMWKLPLFSVVALSLAIAILWITGAQQAQAAVKCTYEYNDETHMEERVCRYYPDPTATPKPTAKPKPTAAPTRVKPTPIPTRVRPMV
jgi:hypothetical protein